MGGIKRFIKRRFKVYLKLPQNANFRKGYLFIHIPKNAGTSLGKLLGIKKPSHLYLRDFENQILPEHFRELKVIAVIRNPWDRFVSLYNYARLDVSHYHNNIHPEKSLFGVHKDYETLKHASLNDCAHLLVEGALKHSYPNTQWNPQSEWLKDNTGRLADAYFLGRVESLNEEIGKLERFIGPSQPLPHINRSTKADYRDLLDQETRNIVTRYYEEDIENFKYRY